MNCPGKGFKELEDIEKPSTLVSLTFVNKGKSAMVGLEKFKNLIELDLSGNSLSSQVIELLSLKYLKKLSLSRNSISSIWDLPKTLEHLSLSENFIICLDPCISQLSRLQFLDISQNCITSLKPLLSLPQLKSLYASKNKIQTLEGLESCTDLIELDIESNNIQSQEDLCQVADLPSLSLINIKSNPCHKSGFGKTCKNLALNSFSQQVEGVYCRNLEKLQGLKWSKFKVVGKKLKKEEFYKIRKRPTYRSRITSMQEIYEQVISEDPEMESLNSSESEERLSLDEFKKPKISKLQLDKIAESQNDKISCEKWSTKPESTLEFLLEDLVQYCKIDDNIDKCLSTDCRLELVFKILKEREDQRLNLIGLVEGEGLVKSLESCKDELEKNKRLVVEANSEIQKLSFKLAQVQESMKAEVDELRKRESELKLKVHLLEEERNSSRFNFSYSYDSEFSEHTDITMGRLSTKDFCVRNEVAEYISSLLSKISRLVHKSKKLRSENQKLKASLGLYLCKSSSNL